MKILMINFLRLGDVLMTAPLINSFRRRYPGAEIHYFIFREFEVASEVMGNIEHWHSISRNEIFNASKDTLESLLTPTDIIDAKCRELQAIGFDLVINLTHTAFSSLCAGLINGKKTIGTYFDGSELKFSSGDFKAFNERTNIDDHHYLDWYRIGFGLNEEVPDWNFNCDFEGCKSALKGGPLQKGRRSYLFQALSSDEKKAWSEEKWLELFGLIRRRDPFADLKMICAPFERKSLEPFSRAANVDLLAVGLKEAYSLINNADYFITLDTSTKHLANDARCKVIELCLGSADFRKQPIYRAGSIILSPIDDCYPCSPKSFCHKAQRSCAKGIAPSDVIGAIEIHEGEAAADFLCRVFLVKSDLYWKCEEIFNNQGVKLERPKTAEPAFENHRET